MNIIVILESLRFYDVDDNANFKIYSSVFQLKTNSKSLP